MRASRLVTVVGAVGVALATLSCGTTDDAGPPRGTTPGSAAAPITATTGAPSGTAGGGPGPTAGPTAATAPQTTAGGPTVSPPGPSPTTTAASSPTTPPDGSCPGPGCTDFSISPVTGPGGTAIEVRAVSGRCTVSETVALIPTSPPGPALASGPLVARGASQYGGSITVPPGTAPGPYLVRAASVEGSGTPTVAGACEARFTVTG